jgi:hypothetical protein
MFQRDVSHLFRRAFQHFVDDCADASVIVSDLAFRRPVRRLVLRDLSNRWIDAEFEEVIEFRMEARNIQSVAANLVPVKGFQMSQIENQPMTFRDGARVESAWLQESE